MLNDAAKVNGCTAQFRSLKLRNDLPLHFLEMLDMDFLQLPSCWKKLQNKQNKTQKTKATSHRFYLPLAKSTIHVPSMAKFYGFKT